MDAAENPSRTAFYPQRADLPTTGPPPPSVTILYDGPYAVGMPAAESVSRIRSFLHSPPRIAAARALRGKEAQGLIDLLDQASVVWLLGDNIRGTYRGVQALRLPELDGNLRR